ncbi:SDR family oxidoreductase [Methylophilaceae bacterium]|nr:SDR family oxidoreductase [Methylophilaceae bacterium]
MMIALVLGSTGLIGNTIFRVLSDQASLDVYGTVRSNHTSFKLKNILTNIDVLDNSKLNEIFAKLQPDVVINCVGLTKHLDDHSSPINSILLNSLFPHRLAHICNLYESRLIHISTDCVFSGKKGFYSESFQPDAEDNYGRSKILGEVLYGDSVTIRTSTIGHELNTNYGLLNWFLSQKNKCKGYKNAVFSGLPTVVLAYTIRDYILNNRKLKGLYHLAASPINKFDLLSLIAKIYKKKIDIEVDEQFVIDRSLNGEKFNQATGFKAPDWPELIKIMYQNK